MRISYICSACGAFIEPKQISKDTAFSINTDVELFSESDIYLQITPCKCTYGNKGLIIKALKSALDSFQD